MLARCAQSFIHVQLFAQSLSHVQLFSPPGSSVQGDSPGKNTGVGCHALLQGSSSKPGIEPHLLGILHWEADFFYH